MSDTAYNIYQHYGTAAQRAAFTPSPAAGVQPIYLWYETDTDAYYIYTTAWKGPFTTAGVATRSIVCVIDGGGAAITTGIKADLYIPMACTITAVRMLADQSGSAVVDIWKDTYANYPPTVADTITAAAKPTISAAVKSEDTTLTGWTTAIAAGDTLRFNVDSAATITRLVLILTITVP